MAKKSWKKHMEDHDAYYGAAIFGRPVGKLTPTRIVQVVLEQKASGAWATKTLTENGASAVLVRFSDKADFDAMRILFAGKAGKSQVNFVGATDTFDGVIQ